MAPVISANPAPLSIHTGENEPRFNQAKGMPNKTPAAMMATPYLTKPAGLGSESRNPCHAQ